MQQAFNAIGQVGEVVVPSRNSSFVVWASLARLAATIFDAKSNVSVVGDGAEVVQPFVVSDVCKMSEDKVWVPFESTTVIFT